MKFFNTSCASPQLSTPTLELSPDADVQHLPCLLAAHVWNSNTTAPSASGKKGRQLHLGSFQDGERAARWAQINCLFLIIHDSQSDAWECSFTMQTIELPILTTHTPQTS